MVSAAKHAKLVMTRELVVELGQASFREDTKDMLEVVGVNVGADLLCNSIGIAVHGGVIIVEAEDNQAKVQAVVHGAGREHDDLSEIDLGLMRIITSGLDEGREIDLHQVRHKLHHCLVFWVNLRNREHFVVAQPAVTYQKK